MSYKKIEDYSTKKSLSVDLSNIDDENIPDSLQAPRFCSNTVRLDDYEKQQITEKELINIGKLTAEIENNDCTSCDEISKPIGNNVIGETQILSFLDNFSNERNLNKRHSSLLSLLFRVNTMSVQLSEKQKEISRCQNKINELQKDLKIEKETNLDLTKESEESCKEIEELEKKYKTDMNSQKNKYEKQMKNEINNLSFRWYTYTFALLLPYVYNCYHYLYSK